MRCLATLGSASGFVPLPSSSKTSMKDGKLRREPPRWSGSWRLDLWSEAQGPGLVEPGEEIVTFVSGTRKTVPGFSQWCRVRSNGNTLKRERFRVGMKETSSSCQPVGQVAQGGHGVAILGGSQCLTGSRPDQPGSPLSLSRRLDWRPQRSLPT